VEWPKLKNIIILLLLALNLFFLVLVGEQAYASNRAQARMQTETLALLAMEDIQISEKTVPWGEQYQSVALRRDWDQAQDFSLAEKILGGVTASQAGSPARYSGNLGSAQFYQSGQFTIRLNPGAVPLEGDAERHAVNYLKALGISARVKDLCEGAGETVTIDLWQLWQEEPLLTCQIQMVYQDNALVSVQGMRLSGGMPIAGVFDEGLSTETLLIRLMGALGGSGHGDGYEIRSILPGYLHRTSGVSAQRVTLIPVWRLENGAGEYLLLNCLTGTLEEAYELSWR
jgi:hypothetical protein